ncbi:MAG: hypothetical protein IKX14_01130 [Neisseriaceae bacterium]|nr:hypothetical protein [Neisseriaceae bacterium]
MKKLIENLSIYSTFVFAILSLVALAFDIVSVYPFSIPIGIFSVVLMSISLIGQFAEMYQRRKMGVR